MSEKFVSKGAEYEKLLIIQGMFVQNLAKIIRKILAKGSQGYL